MIFNYVKEDEKPDPQAKLEVEIAFVEEPDMSSIYEDIESEKLHEELFENDLDYLEDLLQEDLFEQEPEQVDYGTYVLQPRIP